MSVHHDPRVSVGPLVPTDYEAVHALEAAELLGPGRIPAQLDADRRTALLWNGVLAQSVVVDSTGGELVGLVTCYDADPRNGHAWLAVRTAAHRMGTGMALLGLGHVINDLFDGWPFHHLYAETTPEALGTIASGLGSVFDQVGVLEHYRIGPDGPEDRIWLALARERWTTGMGARLARRARFAPGTPPC